MRSAQSLLPKTITAQLTGLVISAVLLGVGLSSAVFLYLLSDWDAGARSAIATSARAATIAAVTMEARNTHAAETLSHIIGTAQWPNMQVVQVPIGQLTCSEPKPHGFRDSVTKILEKNWNITPLAQTSVTDEDNSLAIAIGPETALVFRTLPYARFQGFVLLQSAFALATIVFITLFLSAYAVRWIISPLSSIAAAARSFGDASVEDIALSESGALEIVQVAAALNEMRLRVTTLVAERTRMLVAISHDLRTPLTRLRLRTERVVDHRLRDSMLRDIITLDGMLGETLAYLRDGDRSERFTLIDFPSLLQTICAEFCDVGHKVSYDGPYHFAFSCRARALTRAITNIVDNATKHAPAVGITLRIMNRSAIEIEVSDDGPGIPLQLQDKVFEPFFKIDAARTSTSQTGFGLGLSIARDIVERHGGVIILLNNAPQGTKVRVSLRAGLAE